MKALLLLLLLIYPLSALAQTYEWTDSSGTVNFTEDLGKVPKKYRKKVKVLGGNESGAPQIIESNEPVKGKAKDAKGANEKALYGGKDEAAWRNDFGRVKHDLQRAEQDLTELQARLSNTSNMSRSEYLSIQATIKHGEARVKELRRKQERLHEDADKAGVPAEFR